MDLFIDNFDLFADGLRTTLIVTVVAFGLSLVGGTALALLQQTRFRLLAGLTSGALAVVRSVPLLMVIFWAYYLFPVATGRQVSAAVSGTVALAFFYASYIAVIVRSGLLSVPRSQRMAAEASGLSSLATMRYVVLPQALRNMVPALMTQFVSLFLSTSLLYVIGVVEFFRAATIVNNREFESTLVFGVVAAVYLVIATAISTVSRRLEVPKWKAGQAVSRRPRDIRRSGATVA
jgi:His/Glu/Gln/Arg/opine family amino acid ABC transporter permease subunit